MTFRTIQTLLLAAGLAGSIALPARSLGYEPLPVPDRGRVELVVNDNIVKLRYLLVLNRTDVMGMSLSSPVEQEDGLGSGLALLTRRLGEPPLSQQLANARPVGKLYYALSSLFVVPDGADIDRSKLSIVRGDMRYKPSKMIAEVNLDRRPTESELSEHGVIGTAWQSGDQLILLVDPDRTDSVF